MDLIILLCQDYAGGDTLSFHLLFEVCLTQLVQEFKRRNEVLIKDMKDSVIYIISLYLCPCCFVRVIDMLLLCIVKS